MQPFVPEVLCSKFLILLGQHTDEEVLEDKKGVFNNTANTFNTQYDERILKKITKTFNKTYMGSKF